MSPYLVFKEIDVTPLLTENCNNSDITSPSHTQYSGIDLQEDVSVVYSVNYNLNADPAVIHCRTYTQGRGDVWAPNNGGYLSHFTPSSRFMCPLDGHPLFVRSTCMIGMNQGCHGSTVVFKESDSCVLWRLGIVYGMFYDRHSSPVDVVHMYQWNGDLRMFDCCDWQSMQNFFTLRSFDLSCFEMYFVNQVRSMFMVILTLLYCFLCRFFCFSGERKCSSGRLYQ